MIQADYKSLEYKQAYPLIFSRAAITALLFKWGKIFL